jgi:hypothetical protein
MAGQGYKDFAVGEVLTASDVDQYLMEQSVMRFADASARGSALGTAVGAGTALAEGMMSYLDDANIVQVYDGSGWTSAVAGLGANVVQAVKTDAFSTTSTDYVNVTGLEVTITPSLTSSKILLIATVVMAQSSADSRDQAQAAIAVDTTELVEFAAVLQPDEGLASSMLFLHSPNTTSATTYRVRMKRRRLGTAYLNTTPTIESGTAYASSITAIEVAG